MTPSEVLEFAKNKGAKILDLRFMDFPGLWRSVSDRGRGLIRGRAWL
jgi:glutamine synthetase